MTERIYNFSSGPAVLPLSVLEEARRQLLSIDGVGVSPLEISHRSPWFEGVLDETGANLRKLLGVSDDYAVLFMQGGSRLQFAALPLNLLGRGKTSADFLVTGSWSKMALEEAQKVAVGRCAYNGKDSNFDRLPASGKLDLDPSAAYVHYTSNETIQGVQFQQEPETGGVPLVCDASSDFLSRPVEMQRYGVLFACAQKNAGPAGVTVVIVRRDLLGGACEKLPTMLDYRAYDKDKSMLNTPPCFSIYITLLVTRWLLNDIGGLAKMQEHNRRKAKLLYDVLDASNGFYAGHAQPASRSMMNVTFRLADGALEKKFLAEAEQRGLGYLAGHRSVGGVRASIYNAMPIAGVEKLRDFMLEFRAAAAK